MRLYTYNGGLGDVTQSQINSINSSFNLGLITANKTGSNVAGAVAGGLSIASAAALNPAMLGLTFAACPPCGAALAIGAALIPIIAKIAQGCGDSCIEASDAANQAEPLLVQNVTNYVTAYPRTRALQAQALQNFDMIFSALMQKCQQIGGGGGTNCVKDRVAGACKWKASPGHWDKDSNGIYQWTPAGPSGSGDSCWNWVVGYRDPIANDPGVVPDSAQSAPGDVLNSISNSISSLLGGSAAAGSMSPLLLLALGAVGLYLVMD